MVKKVLLNKIKHALVKNELNEQLEKVKQKVIVFH